MLGTIGLSELIVIVTLLSVIAGGLWIVPIWRVLTRAGFSGWYSLIALIPVINFVALWVFAFADWPAFRKEN